MRSLILILSLSLVSLALTNYTTPWTLLKPSGRTPAPRQLHASIYNNGVWIYGGMSNQSNQGLQVFCDLQHYDDEANSWTLVDNCSRSDYRGPGKLYDSAYAQWRDCFLIFGGTNESGARSLDTWCYNFTSGHWSELVVKMDNQHETDLRQTGLSAVVYEDKFITNSNQQIFVLELTAEPKTWKLMYTDSSITLVSSHNYAMSLQEATGRVWMYAGSDAASSPMRWINWIITSNWTFESPTILAGLPPLSRSKSVFSDGGEYFLWGGYNADTQGQNIERYPNTTYKFINDSGYMDWIAVQAAVGAPLGRVGHSLVRSTSNEIFVFGGTHVYEKTGIVLIYDELWRVSMATQLSLDVTTAECDVPSSFTDQPFQCLIHGRDVDGKITGDTTMAKNFKVVVTDGHNSTISTPQVMYFGQTFHFAFQVNTTGEYKVAITYLNDELPKATPLLVNAECPSMYWGSSCSVNGWWIIGPAIAVVVIVAVIVAVVVVRKRKAGYQPLN